ncbi:MAG: lysostaphin resistance A-like protein [Vicinamibacteria bacterium]
MTETDDTRPAKAAKPLLELGVAFAFLASGLLPGVDTYIVLLLGWLSLHLRRLDWGAVGLRRPSRFLRHVAVGLALGSLWAPLDIFVVEPMIARIVGQPLDLGRFEGVVGNLGNYILMLLIVWLLVAWGEELTYRGYLLNRSADVLGRGRLGWTASLLLVSGVFGLAHAYQRPSGIVTTGYVSFVLGVFYLVAGRNLWLPILAHGAYDTVGLTLIFLGKYPGVGSE